MPASGEHGPRSYSQQPADGSGADGAVGEASDATPHKQRRGSTSGPGPQPLKRVDVLDTRRLRECLRSVEEVQSLSGGGGVVRRQALRQQRTHPLSERIGVSGSQSGVCVGVASRSHPPERVRQRRERPETGLVAVEQHEVVVDVGNGHLRGRFCAESVDHHVHPQQMLRSRCERLDTQRVCGLRHRSNHILRAERLVYRCGPHPPMSGRCKQIMQLSGPQQPLMHGAVGVAGRAETGCQRHTAQQRVRAQYPQRRHSKMLTDSREVVAVDVRTACFEVAYALLRDAAPSGQVSQIDSLRGAHPGDHGATGFIALRGHRAELREQTRRNPPTAAGEAAENSVITAEEYPQIVRRPEQPPTATCSSRRHRGAARRNVSRLTLTLDEVNRRATDRAGLRATRSAATADMATVAASAAIRECRLLALLNAQTRRGRCNAAAVRAVATQRPVDAGAHPAYPPAAARAAPLATVLAATGRGVGSSRWATRGGFGVPAPRQMIVQLARSEDQESRRAAAREPRCPPAVAARLAAAGDLSVGREAAQSQRFPVWACAAAFSETLPSYLTAANRRAAASSPRMPSRLLQQAATSGTEEARAGAAENSACGASLLAQLCRDPDEEVRIAAATNRRTPLRNLREMVYDSDEDDEYVRLLAAGNPSCDEGTLRELAQERDGWLRKGVADNPKTPPEILDTLLREDIQEDICEAAAANPSCSSDGLLYACRHPASRMREAAACNRGAAADILAGLARDDDVRVRRLLAWNPACSQATLGLLASDNDAEVRAMAAANPSTGADTLLRLAADPDEEVRAGAGRWLRPETLRRAGLQP